MQPCSVAGKQLSISAGVSEWVSSFLTAHKHNLGHLVQTKKEKVT